MLLKCVCYNTTADQLHGKGRRLHLRLATFPPPRPQEYICAYCNYVRTKARGLQTGAKEGRDHPFRK